MGCRTSPVKDAVCRVLLALSFKDTCLWRTWGHGMRSGGGRRRDDKVLRGSFLLLPLDHGLNLDALLPLQSASWYRSDRILLLCSSEIQERYSFIKRLIKS